MKKIIGFVMILCVTVLLGCGEAKKEGKAEVKKAGEAEVKKPTEAEAGKMREGKEERK